MKTIGYRICRITADAPVPPARVYRTERAAFAAAKRFANKVGNPSNYTSARVTDTDPARNDAAGWDAYRLAHGIAAR